VSLALQQSWTVDSSGIIGRMLSDGIEDSGIDVGSVETVFEEQSMDVVETAAFPPSDECRSTDRPIDQTTTDIEGPSPVNSTAAVMTLPESSTTDSSRKTSSSKVDTVGAPDTAISAADTVTTPAATDESSSAMGEVQLDCTHAGLRRTIR